MSRSHRQPYHHFCCGADPREGKRRSSREIRRKVRYRLHIDVERFDLCLVCDKTRGHSGTRDNDYGWTYFGDGMTRAWREGIWVAKFSRK